ncbi:MAG: NAD-dependent epimerase [Calditrichia bacterium]
MKYVMVTGAAGFIGSNVAKQLLDQQVPVLGIDNLNDYYSPRLKSHRLDKLKEYDHFRFVQLDIENYAALDSLAREHEISEIINLAARAGVRQSLIDPFVYERTNSMGTLNLLEICRHHNIKKFVLASTSSLYAGQPLPFSESLPVNTPISPYAASKKGAEMMAYSYHYLYNIDITVLRYFTVYGPAGRPDMSAYRFAKQIMNDQTLTVFGDGTQSRDFTYVEDIARGTIKAMKPLGFEIINLGNDDPHELNEMISLIEQNLGKKALIEYKPFHKADIKATWADIDKARKLLEWEPQVSLEMGIKQLVDWFKANKELVQEIPLVD